MSPIIKLEEFKLIVSTLLRCSKPYCIDMSD